MDFSIGYDMKVKIFAFFFNFLKKVGILLNSQDRNGYYNF